MLTIFISYRRSDSAYAAGHLCNQLKARFGADSVFMDVDDIPLGIDFRDHLNKVINQCDVILAIIGDQWVNCTENTGQRRLDMTSDFVRIEMEAALAKEIPIIPVLVKNATMPNEQDLPDSLKPLAYRNGTVIRSGHDLNSDTENLIQALIRFAEENNIAIKERATPTSVTENQSPSSAKSVTTRNWFEKIWIILSPFIWLFTFFVTVIIAIPFVNDTDDYIGLLATISSAAFLIITLFYEYKQKQLNVQKISQIPRMISYFFLWFSIFGLMSDNGVDWFKTSAPVLESLLVIALIIKGLKRLEEKKMIP